MRGGSATSSALAVLDVACPLARSLASPATDHIDRMRESTLRAMGK